jgi:hypothetical protein
MRNSDFALLAATTVTTFSGAGARVPKRLMTGVTYRPRPTRNKRPSLVRRVNAWSTVARLAKCMNSLGDMMPPSSRLDIRSRMLVDKTLMFTPYVRSIVLFLTSIPRRIFFPALSATVKKPKGKSVLYGSYFSTSYIIYVSSLLTSWVPKSRLNSVKLISTERRSRQATR